MTEILFFSLGLAALAIAAFFAFKKRHDTSKCIASITLGILFATFLMVMPTAWVKEGKVVENPVLYAVLSSLLYSFKALGGRQDIAQLEAIALDGVLKTVYVYVNYLMFALAPILASSLVLSFIGDTGEKIRYFFSRSPKCYVFSELNDNALSLAKGILKKSRRNIVVFCNTKDVKKDLTAKAKETGAILLHKSCEDMRIGRRFKVYEFCLMSTDEDKNLKAAELLATKCSQSKKAKIIVNAFVESGTNSKFLESVFNAKSKENTKLELRCIDEIALFCNHLIYTHPLYNTKGKGKTISVAIIGCGRTGMRMLKTVYWAGQIDGYSLKIRVYDKDADDIRGEFYNQCPGLEGEDCIKFIKANVAQRDFKEKLLKADNSADATYMVVAMGDDQLNLSVAEELYRVYRRKLAFDDQQLPEIFARVRSEVKTGPYFDNAAFLDDRHIHLFGTTESVFSENTLFDTELENLSLAVHLTYCSCLQQKKGDADYDNACKAFNTCEYDRRASMSTAIHIPAKLHMCQEILKQDEWQLTEKTVGEFAKKVQDNVTLCDKLAMNEHKRWNAFLLSEGYQTATKEEMLTYGARALNHGKLNHKDDLSMLHPCIVDWDDLNDLENAFNTQFNAEKKFKFHDENIVKSVAQIWKVAQDMNGDDESVFAKACRYVKNLFAR